MPSTLVKGPLSGPQWAQLGRLGVDDSLADSSSIRTSACAAAGVRDEIFIAGEEADR